MIWRTLLVIVAAAAGCSPGLHNPSAGAERADIFVGQWLKMRGRDDVVIDKEGIGVAGSPIRFQASRYHSKWADNGGIAVEVEFTVRQTSLGSIRASFQGVEKTEEEAAVSAFLEAALMFEVVHKAFIDPEAEYTNVTETIVEVAGERRAVIAGCLNWRGFTKTLDGGLAPVHAEIPSILKECRVGPSPHWIEIVYRQDQGKSSLVAVTLDNVDHPVMTEAVKQLNWPRTEGSYSARQFLAIRAK